MYQYVLIYNEAMVLGNQTFPSDLGAAAVNAVKFYTEAMHYTTLASDARRDYNILQNIPIYNAFYIFTHGNNSGFNDCYSSTESGFITDSQITQAVAAKTSSQPPYHFVYIDACHSAGVDTPDPYLCNAFGIVGYAQDRAMLGWMTFILVNSANVEWTERFLANLASTHTVYDAVNNAQVNGVKQTLPEDNNGVAISKIFGDTTAKVHGVYGGATGVWYFPD